MTQVKPALALADECAKVLVLLAAPEAVVNFGGMLEDAEADLPKLPGLSTTALLQFLVETDVQSAALVALPAAIVIFTEP